MKNKTIKKVNTYAPIIILIGITFTLNLDILQSICLGVLMGIISQAVNSFYNGDFKW